MTPTLSAPILAGLGITDPAELRQLSRHDAPEQAVAQGSAVANLKAAAASLLLWHDVGGVALRHAHVPAFVAFHDEDVAEVVAGAPVRAEGRLAFDSDAGQACVRMVDGTVCVADHGAVTQYALTVVDRFADLEVEPAPPAIPASHSVRWAEQLQAEPWLRDAVAALASHGSGLSDAASAGLLARLWVPPRGVTLPREQRPGALARTWIEAATPEQRAALEQHAVYRAGELADSIPDIRDEAALLALIEQRDDLQSVFRLLRLSGSGQTLERALAALDDEADDHLESFANLLPAITEGPDAARWMAVAWQEPDAWWTGTS